MFTQRSVVVNLVHKTILEVVNLLCNNRFGFAFAKRLRLFDAVFIMYPADQSFADYFTFRFRQKRIKWSPFITGVITHPTGKRTLMFAISAYVDGKDGFMENEMLRKLHDKTDLIKERLTAKTTHFAGTLPGRFVALRIRRGNNQMNERQATQQNVTQAIVFLRAKLLHSKENPVVILGSRGYVGKEVVKALIRHDVHVIEIDKNANGSSDRYIRPSCPHIVVNITVPEAINEYVHPEFMGRETVLLNEVYPAPHSDVIAQLTKLGVQVFHLAGVDAHTWPPFPSSYQGAVPCCAALPDVSYQVKLVQLGI